MNILITGKPKVGKTSLIRQTIALHGQNCHGFYTRAIRDQEGSRIGFEMVTLDGKTALLAHVDHRTANRVGRYFINVDNIDQIIVPCLEQAIAQAQIIVIDEIGKMELLSSQFRKHVLRALDAPVPVLATITMTNLPFVKRIKARRDVMLLHLTRENRAEIYQVIVDLLGNEINQ